MLLKNIKHINWLNKYKKTGSKSYIRVLTICNKVALLFKVV